MGTRIDSFHGGPTSPWHVKITLPDGRAAEADGETYVKARNRARHKLGVADV